MSSEPPSQPPESTEPIFTNKLKAAGVLFATIFGGLVWSVTKEVVTDEASRRIVQYIDKQLPIEEPMPWMLPFPRAFEDANSHALADASPAPSRHAIDPSIAMRHKARQSQPGVFADIGQHIDLGLKQLFPQKADDRDVE